MSELFLPLHPKVIHFPIALFMTALLLELISLLKKDLFHQCAVILYIAATLITPLVVRTGIWEATRIRLNHPVLDSHHTYALWTMWLSLASLPILWLLNKQRPRWVRPVFMIFLIAVVTFVTVTGHYGGRMVFEYGVGTELF